MEEWEGRALGSHPANLGSSRAEGVDPMKEVTFLPVQAAEEHRDAAGARTRGGVAEGRCGLGDKRTFPGGHTTCRLSESWDPGANL